MEERRRFKRHPVEGIEGSVSVASERDSHVNIKRMSYGGMLMEITRELSPGDVFPMEITLSGRPARFSGRIASAVKLQSGSYDMGVQFMEMPPDSRAVIDDFVDALEKTA